MKNYQFIIILLTWLVSIHVTHAVYCSAFCSYDFDGNSYVPQCSGTNFNQCTKCDQRFFILNGTQCVPHVYYNQTLYSTQLNPAVVNLTTELSNWNSLNGNVEQVAGQVEFYYRSGIPNTGGDDKLYRVLSNLPAHYAIRVRFYVQRESGSDMNFYYYIDSTKYTYSYGNFPSSISLGDIVTSSKIQHHDSTLTLAFETIFGSIDKWIRIKQVMVFISKCPSHCLSCNSSVGCNSCEALPNGTKTYLYQGLCYFDCPQTTFENNTVNTCDPCANECQNCDINSTYCSQCKNQGRYQTFLLNNTCHYNCPDGFFEQFDLNTCICPVDGYFINNTYQCQSCAPECNSCFGTLRTQCYNCTAGNYLVQGTTWCSRTCPSDQYTNNLTSKCLSCAPTCGSCQNTATQCTSCFFSNSNRYLYNKYCVYGCPDGYKKNNITRICQKCPPFYYSYLSDCVMECPIDYISNNQSKSCLHLSETNLTIDVLINKVNILLDEQSMIFQLLFSQGLSTSSKSWISTQSYYHVYLTNNEELNTTSQGVIIIDDTNIQLTFKIPNNKVTQHTQFLIYFSKKLTDSKGIFYNKTTLKFRVKEHPQFLRDFYDKRQKNYYHVVLIPVLIGLAILLLYKFRATYELLIQKIRVLQLIGLSIFITYPIQSQAYFLLNGINYFNLQFMPNIYHMFVPNLQNTVDNQFLLGYEFVYGDMDFIRMIGSILTFIAFWICLLLVIKYIANVSNQTFGWTFRLGIDLIEIKILHSFWSSLIFTIINAGSNNIFIFLLHIFAFIFLGFVLFRYYKIYQSSQQINILCIWRVISTFLLTIAIFQPIIVFIVLMILSAVIGLYQFSSLRQKTKQAVQYKWGSIFIFRDLLISLFPLLATIGASFLIFYNEQIKSQDMIILFSVFEYSQMLIILIVIIILYRFYDSRQRAIITHIKKQDKWQQRQLYNTVEQNSTIGNVISQNQYEKSSYIKDQFDKGFNNQQQNEKDHQLTNNYQNENQDNQNIDEPVFNKLYALRQNKTEMIRKKQTGKVEPLKTIQNQDQINDVEFQKIDLSSSKYIKNKSNIQQPIHKRTTLYPNIDDVDNPLDNFRNTQPNQGR